MRICCDKLYIAGTAPATDTSMYIGEVKRGYNKYTFMSKYINPSNPGEGGGQIPPPLSMVLWIYFLRKFFFYETHIDNYYFDVWETLRKKVVNHVLDFLMVGHICILPQGY